MIFLRGRYNGSIPPDPDPDPPVDGEDEPESFNRVFTLSPGSNVEIDGSNFISGGDSIELQPNDLIQIPEGTYGQIDISNLIMPVGQRVFIKNAGGAVNITGNMYLQNVNGLSIIGNGAGTKGFNFSDIGFRALTFGNGVLKNFTLKESAFLNCEDYTIFDANRERIYDGTAASVVENLRFANLSFNNCVEPFSLWGYYGDNAGGGTTIKGMKRGVEIDSCEFRNSSSGTQIRLDITDDSSVHDCIFDSLNATNNNHNGIIFLVGNGNCYRNKCTNHQGNLIRAWGCNFSDTANKRVDIYHNKVYNSRKYSGFEIGAQPYQWNNTTLYHPCNYKMYNNTVGRMNTEGDGWPGQLMDVYVVGEEAGGSIEFYNNLGFELDNDGLIHYSGSTTPAAFTRNDNNYYYQTAAEAVNNINDLNSLFPGIGATI